MDGKLSSVSSWLNSFHLPLPKGKLRCRNSESPLLALRSVREMECSSMLCLQNWPASLLHLSPTVKITLTANSMGRSARGIGTCVGLPPQQDQLPGPHQGCRQPPACSVLPVRAATLGRSSGNAAAFSSCLDFGLFFTPTFSWNPCERPGKVVQAFCS